MPSLLRRRCLGGLVYGLFGMLCWRASRLGCGGLGGGRRRPLFGVVSFADGYVDLDEILTR